MSSTPNLPANIIRNILTKRLEQISKNAYSSYQNDSNSLYNNKPLAFLGKYLKELNNNLTKENKENIRKRFTKMIYKDRLIVKIMREFRSIVFMTAKEELFEINKLRRNEEVFRSWANPKWVTNPGKSWTSLWKKYMNIRLTV